MTVPAAATAVLSLVYNIIYVYICTHTHTCIIMYSYSFLFYTYRLNDIEKLWFSVYSAQHAARCDNHCLEREARATDGR